MEIPNRPCAANKTPNIHALRQRDEQAFRHLVERESDRLYHFVLRIISDADEAENIVQETFAEAYRQIDRFRGDAKVSTWLFAIARHLAYGVLRRSKRRDYHAHDTIEYLHAHNRDGFASAVFEVVEREERRQIVHDALQELPPHYRRVLELRDLQERTTAETAQTLGLTPVNVRVRLHRARKELRDHLCARMECGDA